MIVEPELRVADFAKAGADIISVHAEPSSTIHLHRTLNMIKDLGCKAGVVLNPGTSLSTIEEVLDVVDLVLIMSVNPGFGGQSFIESQVAKIRALKQMCVARGVDPWIEVDGGVTPANAWKVIDAGANALVAGSAVFKAPSYRDGALWVGRHAGPGGFVKGEQLGKAALCLEHPQRCSPTSKPTSAPPRPLSPPPQPSPASRLARSPSKPWPRLLPLSILIGSLLYHRLVLTSPFSFSLCNFEQRPAAVSRSAPCSVCVSP